MYKMDVRDIVGGGVLFAFGAISAFIAHGYGIGTVRNMGPGFFPLTLAVILMAFGAAIFLPALRRGGEAIEMQWRNIIVVTGTILFFGAVLTTLGILLTVFMTVILASFATQLTLKQAAVSGVVMTAFVWAVFILGLSMTIPLTPWSY